MKTTARLALAPLALLLAGIAGCSAASSAPEPQTTTIPAQVQSEPQSFQSVAAPDFTGEEKWRTNAKQTDSSGILTYSNTIEGATIAFEDFFNTMAIEFSTQYTAEELEVTNEEEKTKLIDKQLFRTMRYLDRDSLGTEKVSAIIKEWVMSSRMFGVGQAEIKASRDGVTIVGDGTTTLTDGHVFYKLPSSTKATAVGSDHEHYKLAYKNGRWVIVDVNLDGSIQQ